jgi:peptidoglycan L-alanyl-D-glutamate endopeptidase CwlK
MEGINPILILFANRVLAKSKIDLTIPWRGGLRTVAQQQEIFSRGASTRDGVIKESYHQTGNAVDIVAAGRTEKERYNEAKLKYVNSIAKQVWKEMVAEGLNVFGDDTYYMTFGGDWKRFVDYPHYQIKKLK